MTPKIWFLIREENGRIEICSKGYETLPEALEAYNNTSGTMICETIYG